MQRLEINFQAFREIAHRSGLELVSCLDRAQADEALALQREALNHWQVSGFAGELSYMNRPADLFTSLENFLPSARSVICLMAPYSSADPGPCPPGFGRVARYAWGEDYHTVLRKRLEGLVGEITKELAITVQELEWRIFSDAVPLLERALARTAGLGFVGKNGLIIRPGIGSYTFLAEVLLNLEITDLEPERIRHRGRSAGLDVLSDGHDTETADNCSSCASCLEACPTEAFSESRVLDSRRCISYLTIEKRGEFNSWEQDAISDWVFGCDLCQECCPFNHSQSELALDEFHPTRGVGPFLEIIPTLIIREGSEFRERFRNSALLRARREGLLRNASSVVANTHYYPAVDALCEAAQADSSQLVRSHARYALERLERDAEGIDKRRIRSAI